MIAKKSIHFFSYYAGKDPHRYAVKVSDTTMLLIASLAGQQKIY